MKALVPMHYHADVVLYCQHSGHYLYPIHDHVDHPTVLNEYADFQSHKYFPWTFFTKFDNFMTPAGAQSKIYDTTLYIEQSVTET